MGKITHKITNTQIFKPKMIELNLPPYEYRLKRNDLGNITIWDNTRRRYVALTPEEWVRQHFVAYLIAHLNYPAGRIGNEISLTLNNLHRRCDTIIYDTQGAPIALVEYKAPHIIITQDTFDQIVRYNMHYCVPYLIVTNGLTHYCCHIDYTTRTHTFLQEIPTYDRL